MTQGNANQEHQYMTRRIGSTTYKVKVVFAVDGETLEEKILRMIRNEGSAAAPLLWYNKNTTNGPVSLCAHDALLSD